MTEQTSPFKHGISIKILVSDEKDNTDNKSNIPVLTTVKSRRNSLCPVVLKSFVISNQKKSCEDDFMVDPKKLKLLPREIWGSKPPARLFSELSTSFFRRNGRNIRFNFKLHNLLMITKECPQRYPVVGVLFIGPEYILVNGEVLAKVLGVKTDSYRAALFHQQGNFKTHGFVELFPQNIDRNLLFPQYRDININAENESIFTHEYYNINSNQEDVESMRWVSSYAKKASLPIELPCVLFPYK